MRKPLPVSLAAAALAAAVLSAPVSVSASAEAAEARIHIVEIRNLQFSPAELEVAPGDTIVWINADLVPHTVTADDKSWGSQRLASDDRWQMTVGDGMPQSYFCRYHPSMKARLHVQPE